MAQATSVHEALSRRSFVCAGGAAAAVVAGSTALTGLAKASEGDKVTVSFVDTIAWDAEYDVVVVGWGGAGSVAAITAAENGAKVLLTEKASEGGEGGNTKVCEQYLCTPNTVEDGIAFYTAMSAGFDTSTPEVIQYMAEGSVGNVDWLLAHGAPAVAGRYEVPQEEGEADPNGTPSAEMATWIYEKSDGTKAVSEYPIWPDGTPMDGRIDEFKMVNPPDHEEKKYWNLLRENVVALKDSIDIWYESPATHLIQDPFTKTILGLKVERGGKELNVRALNGVVLACGSYEANQEMFENYAQFSQAYPIGTTNNTGDGIKMGLEVGADLWHMDALSGPWILPKFHEIDRCYFGTNIAGQRITTAGNCIYVGSDAKRFMNESGTQKHGHVQIGGSWISQPVSDVMWAVMDATGRNGGGTIATMDEAEIIEGASLEELAEAIGLDAEALSATVAEWNDVVAAGVDPKFDRLDISMAPIETAPFYAVRLYPACVNCQGGPKRNTNCEVLDPNGNPIPNLYSAGELGSFWAGVYICGGNISETCYTGRTAGENAAKPKDAPAPVELTVVASTPTANGSDYTE